MEMYVNQLGYCLFKLTEQSEMLEIAEQLQNDYERITDKNSELENLNK